MRRRSLTLALIGLAALAILYTIYWIILGRILDENIAGWAALRRAEGYAVSYEATSIGGYPFTLTTRFRNPEIAAPHGAWLWRGPETQLRLLPWAPYTLQFWAPGRHRLQLGGPDPREVEISGDWLSLDIHLQDGVLPDRFGLTLGAGVIDDGRSGVVTMQLLAAEARLPRPPAGDPDKSSLDLLANVLKLELPGGAEVLGREIWAAHLAAQVMGTVPDGEPREALAAWSDAGGALELRRLEGYWAGVYFKGDGTLALDRSLQPLFAGSFAVAGLGGMLDKLAAAGILQPGPAQMAKLMFAALAAPLPDGGPPQVKLPLTVQDGYLYTGPIKLAPLRPLDWSWLP